MDLREIITIQVGHYSNFVGTHWWNIQESGFSYDKPSESEINHDYLFREGQLSRNQTSYTPRLLLIDAKGSLGSLPVSGTLYDPIHPSPSTSHAAWEGRVELVHQIPEEKNDFLKSLDEEDELYSTVLDEDKDVCSDHLDKVAPTGTKKIFHLSSKVRVWSDFLRIHYHPKTTVMFNEIRHFSKGLGNGGFQCGRHVMKKEENDEEVTDRIRMLAEGCGSLQGFTLLCDVHNEMGGISSHIGEHLSDEFGRKDVLSFLITPPHIRVENSTERNLLLSSIVQSYNELNKNSELVVPLNLSRHSWHPWDEGVRWRDLTVDFEIPYESSCLLAAFIDTISLPLRTKVNALPMSALVQLLSVMGRKFVGGSLSFPLGMEEGNFFEDYLSTMPAQNSFNLVPLTSNSSIVNNIAESITMRGIGKNNLFSSRRRLPQNLKIETAEDLLNHHIGEKYPSGVDRHLKCVGDPLQTTVPFPQIFRDYVNSTGYLNFNLRGRSGTPEGVVSSAPCAAGLHQGSGVGKVLGSILQDSLKIDVAKIPKLIEEDVTKEIWTETLEDLRNIVRDYKI